MNSLSVTNEQFSDILNLYYGSYFPLKHFNDEKNFKNILLKKKVNNKFFPLPIFFGINKKKYFKIKNKKIIKLFFENKYIAAIKIKNFFNIKKKFFGRKLFGLNYKKHPYYLKFSKENYIFLDFEYIKINKKNLRHKYFVPPSIFKKKLKKVSTLAGFHTRNVPHTAHQWVHKFMIKKYSKILIQPLIGQYKKGEYLDSTIIKANLLAIQMYDKKALYVPYFSYPRYGGPLESALHALVRKNYGCTHFWVGRDHAGYKKYFSKYSSQSFCFKNQNKLGIKIIVQKEPYYCHGCKKIVNKKCLKNLCKRSLKIVISGTKVRNYLRKNKDIPEIIMNKKISKILNKNSIINSLKK